MTEKARELADTYFVRQPLDHRPTVGFDSSGAHIVAYPCNAKIFLANGRSVKALDRKLFEDAVRAATLKK